MPQITLSLHCVTLSTSFSPGGFGSCCTVHLWSITPFPSCFIMICCQRCISALSTQSSDPEEKARGINASIAVFVSLSFVSFYLIRHKSNSMSSQHCFVLTSQLTRISLSICVWKLKIWWQHSIYCMCVCITDFGWESVSPEWLKLFKAGSMTGA